MAELGLGVPREGNAMVLAVIRNADRVEEYECHISACENPVCTCDSVYLELLPVPEGTEDDPPRRPHKVSIKLSKKKLDYTRKFGTPLNDLDFSRPFLSALDENDFRLLREKRYLFKNRISESAAVDSIEVNFAYDQIERDGLMWAYNEVLPYGDQMTVTIGDKAYLILDHFCLLPNCSCRDSTLSMVHLDPVDKSKNEFHSVGLNYRKKKWTELDKHASSLPVAAVRSAFEEQIPDLYENLRARHVKLKAIYGHCKKRHITAKQPAPISRVGRNDPCPCGSGKKYKRCCLGKNK